MVGQSGLSEASLSNITRHLQERYITPGKIAGTVTVVHRKGETAFFEALGKADLENNRPMEKDTIFRIYSMTKPITSIALMQLYEQGKFQLSDPVHRFIPKWKNLRVYDSGNKPLMVTTRPERPMQIHDLFTHMSGLTYGFTERTNVDAMYRDAAIGCMDKAPRGTVEDMVNDLAEIPLEFSPGSRWNYSVATDVLGHLVELIADMPLDDYFKKYIFEPLNMVDTDFCVPLAKKDRFANCYMRGYTGEIKLQDNAEKSHYLKRPKFLSGGGGLVSTASDYLNFSKALLNGGALEGSRVIGRKTLEFMATNHIPGNKDLGEYAVGRFSESLYEGVGFGLGFSVSLDPTQSKTISSVGEYAWGGAASTAFWVDPVEDMVVVFMTQYMPSAVYNFRGQLKQIIYGAIAD